MQFKAITLSALVATVAAQTSSSVNILSIYSVLQTAVPSSLIQEALTNSGAVSSQIASEFEHSETPTWFTALPTDIQTFLVPALASTPGAGMSASANASAISRNSTAITASQSSILASISAQNSSVLASASAGPTTTSGSGAASSGSSSGATASAAGSASSSGSGAVPTAVVGMGLAGIVGMVGVLAL